MIDINKGYDYIDKTITFTEGAYKVNHINAIIQQKIYNESIKLVVDKGSARCKIIFNINIKLILNAMIHFEIYVDLMQ